MHACAITSVLAYYFAALESSSRPNKGRPRASWMKMDLFLRDFLEVSDTNGFLIIGSFRDHGYDPSLCPITLRGKIR